MENVDRLTCKQFKSNIPLFSLELGYENQQQSRKESSDNVHFKFVKHSSQYLHSLLQGGFDLASVRYHSNVVQTLTQLQPNTLSCEPSLKPIIPISSIFRVLCFWPSFFLSLTSERIIHAVVQLSFIIFHNVFS